MRLSTINPVFCKVDREFRPWAAHSGVTVRIYRATGQLIRAMHLGYREAGSYVARDKAAYWNGRSEAGEPVSSGVYFYTVQAGDSTATKKMIVAR